MTAHVVDEFLVLEKYRVMVLDRDVEITPHDHYQINGKLYDAVMLHIHKRDMTIPMNYIAIKATESLKGFAVEFV